MMGTPYKRAPDSPSRQLLYELNQLAISSQEGFYAQLDRENEEREDLHKQALATAARRHERVRQNAEVEKQRLEAEQEAGRKRDEDEQRRALEKQRQENQLAEQRREAERARAEESHQKELAEIQRSKDEAEESRKAEKERQDGEIRRRVQEKHDADRKQQDDAKTAEAKAKENAVAAMKARQQPAPDNTPPKPQPASQPTPQHRLTYPARNPAWESEHARYLQIHRQLKELRKFMTNAAKARPELKAALGNMRRDIKKSVGQLTLQKGANKKPLSTIITTLKKALTLPEPKVNILLFLATPPSNPPPDTNGPALMVYLLNEFSKAIIAQFIDEAGVSPKAADPVGIVASHIFALGEFRWEGISLIDILLAKLHVVAPAIFGISGSENTVQGKQRLGWWRGEGRSEGPFVPQQTHFERMTGLGAGFAALSLRNYEKAKVENPFPDRHYWEALARMLNVPPSEITQTHFVLLKAMIEGYETKFINFYGGAALAALSEALVELPARCPPSVTSKSLAGLIDVLRREKKLCL